MAIWRRMWPRKTQENESFQCYAAELQIWTVSACRFLSAWSTFGSKYLHGFAANQTLTNCRSEHPCQNCIRPCHHRLRHPRVTARFPKQMINWSTTFPAGNLWREVSKSPSMAKVVKLQAGQKGLAVKFQPHQNRRSQRKDHLINYCGRLMACNDLATRAPTQWRLASVWLGCPPSAHQAVSVDEYMWRSTSACFTCRTRLYWRFVKFDACILQASPSLSHPTNTRSFPRFARHLLKIHLLVCF